ncbi:hypothetical protein GCM10010486_14020 [Nonomuraea roseoviolacea subsp. carminata]
MQGRIGEDHGHLGGVPDVQREQIEPIGRDGRDREGRLASIYLEADLPDYCDLHLPEGESG